MSFDGNRKMASGLLKEKEHVGEKEEGQGRVTGRKVEGRGRRPEMGRPQDSRGFLSTGNLPPWAQGP